jgi:hypothetical protein
MLDSMTFWLVVLVLLVAFLCVSVLRRAVRRRSCQREPGRAFDVSKIAPRVHLVHEDPLRVLHATVRSDEYKQHLLAMARKMISHLAFFRNYSAQQQQTHHG